MTTPPTSPDPTDPPASIRASLLAYTPPRVSPTLWSAVREDAVDLVLRAGPLTAERTRKDLQLLAEIALHLSGTRVEVTLDNLLADTTLASFDVAQVAARMAAKTLENKRGRFRRMQAAQHQAPWRRARRGVGERITTLVQPEILETVTRLLPATGAPGARGAGALQAALDDARRRRRSLPGPELDCAVWAAARTYARDSGTGVTKRELDAMATYEVLVEPAPVASLAVSYALTRRDLDLALTLAARLPQHPGSGHWEALRG